MLKIINFLVISVVILANTSSADDECWRIAFGKMLDRCDEKGDGHTDMACVYRKIGLIDKDNKVHPQKLINYLRPKVVNQVPFNSFERINKNCAKTVETEAMKGEDVATYMYFCHLEFIKQLYKALDCEEPEASSEESGEL